MNLGRNDSFKKDYRALPQQLRRAVDKQIVQVLLDHTHPSLHLEPITGHRGLYSVRVNDQFRMSLSFEPGGIIMLRRVLNHDELYRSP